MVIRADILVVGGGPGGLACAAVLAQGGARVVLAERKPVIGPKVCAGGITWHGLLRHVPAELIEQSFPEQHIVSPWQRVMVAEPNPIIATVDRLRLGQWMAEQAVDAGATLLPATRVTHLEPNRARLAGTDGQSRDLHFDHLVGADGSNSLVRRFVGLPSMAMGMGLNVMLPLQHPRMEWHLAPKRFGAGYAWIFPHRSTCSLGAYCGSRAMTVQALKRHFLLWADEQGFRPDPAVIRAGLVNYDYRGVRFGRTWLVGDAAGLASGLTGEGIYPAMISGRAVARMILGSAADDNELTSLARKHRQHTRLVALASGHPRLRHLLMELATALLRMKVIAFHSLEMAD